MTELISFASQVFGNESVNTVNARDIWVFVESKNEFAHWIKDRLEDFEESVDFTLFGKNPKNEFGFNIGRPLKEYYLTIECAKHICMLERNAKGKELRQYFIDCEKKLNNPQSSIPSYRTEDRIQRAKEWIIEQETAERLLLESEQAKQKALAQADYQMKALVSSQRNNTTKTLEIRSLRGKLRGFDDYCSLNAWLSRNKISTYHSKIGRQSTKSIVASLKKFGMPNEEYTVKTFADDQFPTTIFLPFFLDEQKEFILSEIERLIQSKLQEVENQTQPVL